MNLLLVWLAVQPSLGLGQTTLEEAARSFAQAWEREDTGQIRGKMMVKGIRLHLPGEDHDQIRPRQAQAALDTFLEGYSAGEASVSQVSLAAGDVGKGFAEIGWRAGSPGVTEPVIFTLFVAFVLEGESWSVSEIRVLF